MHPSGPSAGNLAPSRCDIVTWALIRNRRRIGQASPKAQVSSTQALECDAVGPNDIRVDRLGGGHQPGIVLAHSAFRATLQKGTPPRLGQMHPMDRKPLQ